jgi:hypothetical protein
MNRSTPARAASFASLLFLTSLPALLAAACGGLVADPAERSGELAGGEQGGSRATRPRGQVGSDPPVTPLAPTACPETEPSEQHWCPKAFVVCAYADDCSQRPSAVPAKRSYECTASRWTRMSSRYPVVCPSALPSMGEPCEVTCEYEACNYATPCGTASAVCDHRLGAWQVSGLCADGGSDGGADSDAAGGTGGGDELDDARASSGDSEAPLIERP